MERLAEHHPTIAPHHRWRTDGSNSLSVTPRGLQRDGARAWNQRENEPSGYHHRDGSSHHLMRHGETGNAPMPHDEHFDGRVDGSMMKGDSATNIAGLSRSMAATCGQSYPASHGD